MITRAATIGSIVAVLALLSGCGGGSSVKSAPRPTVESGPPQPTPRATKVADAAPTHPDDAAFWRLIAETRQAAGNDTGRQSELLKDRLTQLSPQAIIEFARTRHRLDQRAYTWDIWGAASVIEDGCSDDCFRDFRGYLISLGRGPVRESSRQPRLAGVGGPGRRRGRLGKRGQRCARCLFQRDWRRLPAGRLRSLGPATRHAIQRQQRSRPGPSLPAARCTLP
jgi:hypothetical protein